MSIVFMLALFTGCGPSPDETDTAGQDTAIVTCDEGLEICSGTCADTQLSEAHCGTCDSPCEGTCIDGGCVTSPAGFAPVPASTSTLGSPDDEDGRDFDELQHTVTIGSLYAGVTEVTQREWLATMGTNPSTHYGHLDQPVDSVSWYDALAYCNARSISEGRLPCYDLTTCAGTPGLDFRCTETPTYAATCGGYRLPTEAEWEIMARAGDGAARHGPVTDVAWTAADEVTATQPAGLKAANDWGFVDALGNVAEWTYDGYATYPSEPSLNPTGPAFAAQRVARGGSVSRHPDEARAARRIPLDPLTRAPDVGFRVVRPTQPDPQLDDDADADGDGLTNAEEVDGWSITVDYGVWSLSTLLPESQVVSSDPFNPDSDGDGLADALERAHRLDPSLPDTDGDGLSDYEEIVRWGTSGSSVDTDGDSRLGGSTAPPLSALFDGAELQLVVDPADPTRWIPGTYATSPGDPDTDGDGLSDYDELGAPRRDGGIAELPSMRIEMTPNATFDLYLDVTYSDSEGRSNRYGSTTEETNNIQFSSSTELSAWMSTRLWSETQVEGSVNAGLGSSGIGASGSVSETVGIEASFGTSVTYNFGVDWGNTLREERSREQEASKTRTETYSSGVIRVPFDIVNDGSIAFEMDGLEVIALVFQDGDLVPLGTLEPEGGSTFTLAPGQRAQAVFHADDLNPDRVRRVLERPGGIQFTPGNYQVRNSAAEDYVFQIEAVLGRTAMLKTDFGSGDVEVGAVSANVDHAADGAFAGVPLWQAYERAGLDVAVEPQYFPLYDDLFEVVVIEGTGPVVATTPAPALNDPLPYHSEDPPDRDRLAAWMALIDRGDSDLPGFATDLVSTRIMPGDTVTLVYGEDSDRDGVPARIESLFGLTEGQIDSDGDGLSDYWEIHETRPVVVPGLTTVMATSDPSVADTDGDGLSDLFEFRTSQTDPSNPDSDFDGYSDFDEFYGIRPTFDPDPLRSNPKALDVRIHQWDTAWAGEGDLTYMEHWITLVIRNREAALDGITLDWGEGQGTTTVALPELASDGRAMVGQPPAADDSNVLFLYKTSNGPPGYKALRFTVTDLQGRVCVVAQDYYFNLDRSFELLTPVSVDCTLEVVP